MRFLGLTVFMALALPVAAQEPASIGVTRDCSNPRFLVQGD